MRTPRAPSRGTGRTPACRTPPPLLRARSAGKPITEKIAVYREADTIAALEALRARIRPGVRELDRERSRARPRGRFLLVLAPARQFPLGGQSLVLRGLNLAGPQPLTVSHAIALVAPSA